MIGLKKDNDYITHHIVITFILVKEIDAMIEAKIIQVKSSQT